MTDPTPYVPTGDITIFEIAEFKSQLQAAIDLGQGVTIDLGQAGTLDISALQTLIAACEAGPVDITNAPKRIADQLACLGWVPPKGCKVAYVG
ncbi:MAG: STAS domain-containing protein [Nitrospira sp.]